MQKRTLFQRVGFALRMGWRYRRAIKAYLRDPHLQVKTVLDLDLSRLQQEGVLVLVLDFDGVLGPDHALELAPQIRVWLDKMYEYFSERLFILSNKPLPLREAYLKEHYPKLQFIKGVAKKPYPQGLLLIQSLSQVNANQILFCDDRLLTGLLAAKLANVRALFVTQPMCDFSKRFVRESLFAFLRFLDRTFLWIFG